MQLKYQQYYAEMHSKNYLGDEYDVSLNPKDCQHIKRLVEETWSSTILDFGCGKARQYDEFFLHQSFGIKRKNIHCYDPGVPEFSTIPLGVFDGVISTDVFEHIPEDELEESFKLVFSKATKFVYLAIHCGLSVATLPNGENAHCTIKHPDYWMELINRYNVNKVKKLITFRIPTSKQDDILGLMR